MTLSPAERARQVLEPRWISYPEANAVMARLQQLMDHPPTHRVPSMALISNTHNGKTMLARRFTLRHPRNHNVFEARTTVPVLLVSSPLVPDEGRLYNALLDGFNASYRLKDDPEKKFRQLKVLLAEAQTRMIVIDEIHNILTGYTRKQQLMLTALKHLSNELGLPILVMGTIMALRALQTDEESANRYDTMMLPLWKFDDSFRMFLQQYETTLPLKEASGLSDTRLASRIYGQSEGLIGEVGRILASASRQVIGTSKERITLEVLDKLPDYVSPSQRRARLG